MLKIKFDYLNLIYFSVHLVVRFDAEELCEHDEGLLKHQEIVQRLCLDDLGQDTRLVNLECFVSIGEREQRLGEVEMTGCSGEIELRWRSQQLLRISHHEDRLTKNNFIIYKAPCPLVYPFVSV